MLIGSLRDFTKGITVAESYHLPPPNYAPKRCRAGDGCNLGKHYRTFSDAMVACTTFPTGAEQKEESSTQQKATSGNSIEALDVWVNSLMTSIFQGELAREELYARLNPPEATAGESTKAMTPLYYLRADSLPKGFALIRGSLLPPPLALLQERTRSIQARADQGGPSPVALQKLT